MQTYTSLLSELRTEDQFQLERHFEQFKKELTSGKTPREASTSISESCDRALSNAGKNLLHKSITVGVDNKAKLAEGVEYVNKEYTEKFINQIHEYLEGF